MRFHHSFHSGIHQLKQKTLLTESCGYEVHVRVKDIWERGTIPLKANRIFSSSSQTRPKPPTPPPAKRKSKGLCDSTYSIQIEMYLPGIYSLTMKFFETTKVQK